jgi:outer membrane protein OmpU
MNKLTKIGVSALCGSLAAISAAKAGELSVSGGANMTLTKLGYGNTGNPLGMASSMTFTGTGELDNGSTVTINIAHNDKNTYSASDVSIATPSMGTFTYDEGGGTGIDRFDDKMPTAWEETNGTGVAAGFTTVSGVGGMTDIEWAMPADMLPDGVSAYIAFSPKPDGSKNTDKSSGAASNSAIDGWGYDIAVSHTGLADGLEVFGGYSVIPQYKSATAGVGYTNDKTSKVLGLTYAMGAATVGYQYSIEDLNWGVDGSTSHYANNAFGISFSVNDDLSISYGRHDSERQLNNASSIEIEAESFQVAYSMGGATVKIAETEVDNADYVSTTAGDKEGTTVMLSLAF